MSEVVKRESRYKLRVFWVYRVILPAFLLITIILGIIGATYAYSIRGQRDRNLIFALDSIGPLISEPMILGDFLEVAKRMSLVGKNQGFLLIALDERDTIIATYPSAWTFENRDEIKLWRPIYSNDRIIGKIGGTVSTEFHQELSPIFLLLAGAAILIAISIFVLILRATRGIVKDFENLELFSGLTDNTRPYFLFDETRSVFERIKHQSNLLLETQKKAMLTEVASQVAHDIRSPLAALSMVEPLLVGPDEEKRLLLRNAVNRIKDIANNLHAKKLDSRPSDGSISTISSPAQDEEHSDHLLLSLIEEIVSEKRMQYRSRIGLEIDTIFGPTSYGLFAKVQSNEFKRVISNLINNGVEALEDSGRLTIEMALVQTLIQIKITDNGKGIPDDIIPKLMQKGNTFGKVGGSGLGLFHAKNNVQSWGGKIVIESTVNKGTIVTVFIPQASAPQWFVSGLTLTPKSMIVVLDDDSSIHAIWQKRFDSLGIVEKQIEVQHFSTPDQIRSWVLNNPKAASQALYLTDYELLGFQETGLDLIEKLKLGAQSILVTSHFEEPQIIEACKRLNIRLIPKGMVALIPISFASATEHIDAILIDDDSILHISWGIFARKANKKLLTFSHPDQFFTIAGTIAKSVPIYVDVNLGDRITGVDVAEKIHKMGFTHIYLATGYAPELYQHLTFLRGVIGKDPPF
ncbi:MAG: HAMP domain-containing histidine kinase [Bdellovibrio sp.]|nr:HAMP domain-containing histidine kinase [Bdellovibrio sp.]